MIKLRHNDRNYLITFKRFHEDFTQGGKVTKRPTNTYCFIEEIYGDENQHKRLAAIGESKCHPQDQFTRESGRKRALSRALKQLLPARNGRTEQIVSDRLHFWSAYFNRQADFTIGTVYSEGENA